MVAGYKGYKGVKESAFRKEKAFGALFFGLGILVLKIYLLSFFAIKLPLPSCLKRIAVGLHILSVELPVLTLVLLFLLTIIRIGWNMLTAPPARSLDDLEGSLNRRE